MSAQLTAKEEKWISIGWTSYVQKVFLQGKRNIEMFKMNFSGKENNITSVRGGKIGFFKGEFETNSLKINVFTKNIQFLFLSLKKIKGETKW